MTSAVFNDVMCPNFVGAFNLIGVMSVPSFKLIALPIQELERGGLRGPPPVKIHFQKARPYGILYICLGANLGGGGGVQRVRTPALLKSLP